MGATLPWCAQATGGASRPEAVVEPPNNEGSSAQTGGAGSEPTQPRRVVVVVSPDSRASLPLLRAELQELGLEVVEISSNDAEAASQQATESPEAFRVVLGPSQVDVWIFDRAAGKVTLREVFAQSDGTPIDARTAVLHAVELLRWHLRQREPHTHRPSPPVASSVPSPSPPTSGRRTAWIISLLPQALYSPGGTTLGAGGEIDLGWRSSQVGTRLFAACLFLPNQLASSEGSAKITPRFLGLQGVLLSRPTSTGLGTSLGVGVALVSTALSGSATTPYRGHADHLLTVAPVLDVRAVNALGGSLGLVLSGTLMAPLRSSSLRFGDREVGRYGQLFASVGLGVQATLD